MRGILADWWEQARAEGVRESTHVNYKGTVEIFVKYLGHDDASKIAPEHIVGFKDHRLCTAVRKPSSGAPAFVPARAA